MAGGWLIEILDPANSPRALRAAGRDGALSYSALPHLGKLKLREAYSVPAAPANQSIRIEEKQVANTMQFFCKNMNTSLATDPDIPKNSPPAIVLSFAQISQFLLAFCLTSAGSTTGGHSGIQLAEMHCLKNSSFKVLPFLSKM